MIRVKALGDIFWVACLLASFIHSFRHLIMTAIESCSCSTVGEFADCKMKHDDHVGNISSPTSVVAAQVLKDDAVIEPIALSEWPSQEPTPEGTAIMDKWICPASEKSIRTINPIRAIVDPITKNIQTGEQRGDGKDLISLAVSK